MNCSQKKIVRSSNKEIPVPNMKKSKSMDKMPARKMPEGVKMPVAKKAAPKPTAKVTPKTTTKAPAKTKMTPQDAAMKKILEKKYGKIYG